MAFGTSEIAAGRCRRELWVNFSSDGPRPAGDASGKCPIWLIGSTRLAEVRRAAAKLTVSHSLETTVANGRSVYTYTVQSLPCEGS